MARFTMPVAVHLFLQKKDEILLLRRFQTGYEDGSYSVVAGHIEAGEDALQAMIREAKEEANITLERENMEFALVMHRKNSMDERIDFFFICRIWKGEIYNNEPEKCDHLAWFNIDDLPRNMVTYVRDAWLAQCDGHKYISHGWEI